MDLSIILMIEQQNENVKKVIDSARNYTGKHEIEFILIDHDIRSGYWDWAEKQGDITYVYFDETEISSGKMINDTISELGINNTVLFLNQEQMITYGLIDRLWELLYSAEDIGVTGAVTNREMILPDNVQKNIDSLTEWLIQNDSITGQQVVAFDNVGVMIKPEVIEKCKGFDEDAPNTKSCFMDYYLSVGQLKYKSMICDNAIFWKLPHEDSDVFMEVDELGYMEKKWGVHYFRISPNMYIQKIFTNVSEKKVRVLEIGCDCGANLLGLRNKYPNVELYGCDINQASVDIANNYFTCVQGNIEDYDLPFEDHMFDYIVFADVLEHLRNPLGTIEYCKKLLNTNGHILASIPNVANISVIQDLLKGNFTYQEYGLLDKTHIHMFTYNEIIRMFQRAKFQSLSIGNINNDITMEQKELIDILLQVEPQGTREMYETFQYVVDASDFIV